MSETKNVADYIADALKEEPHELESQQLQSRYDMKESMGRVGRNGMKVYMVWVGGEC